MLLLLGSRFGALLVASTLDHRQSRVLLVASVVTRQSTHDELRPPCRDDARRVHAQSAKTGVDVTWHTGTLPTQRAMSGRLVRQQVKSPAAEMTPHASNRSFTDPAGHIREIAQ